MVLISPSLLTLPLLTGCPRAPVQTALLFADDTASLLELTDLPWGACFPCVKLNSPPIPLGLGMVSPQNFTLLAPGSLLFELMPFFLKALPGARGLRLLTGSGG